ncbi:MAG TPA: group 1 truncated hemoglobin [Bryobacteraceae bacterium]|nr:group 1 truncated hemoglobin [Bryobacteraceae bacterium]
MKIPNAAESSLYQRIGGYDVIANVIDHLFALMRADERFSRFSMGRSLDSRKRAQQLTVQHVCAQAGGPCYYTGRGMRESHAGLNITRAEWDVFLELTREALRKNDVASQEEAEFLSLFERYRKDIIEAE